MFKRLMLSVLATASVAAGAAYLVGAAPTAGAAVTNPETAATFSTRKKCMDAGRLYAKIDNWRSYECYPSRAGDWTLMYTP